jgi:hypothetical protein
MPDLHGLFLTIDSVEWDKATPVGLQQLPSLKLIFVKDVACKEEELIRSVFQEVVDALPTRPTLMLDGSGGKTLYHLIIHAAGMHMLYLH